MTLQKKYILYALGVLTLFIGYLFNENSAGGAKMDYLFYVPFIENFSSNITNGFNSWVNDAAIRMHSPLYYMIISIFYKVLGNFQLVAYAYILICSILPCHWIFFNPTAVFD